MAIEIQENWKTDYINGWMEEWMDGWNSVSITLPDERLIIGRLLCTKLTCRLLCISHSNLIGVVRHDGSCYAGS
jgi:hypothetical protein